MCMSKAEVAAAKLDSIEQEEFYSYPFKTRADYLESLAEEYGYAFATIQILADKLGQEEEDFYALPAYLKALDLNKDMRAIMGVRSFAESYLGRVK